VFIEFLDSTVSNGLDSKPLKRFSSHPGRMITALKRGANKISICSTISAVDNNHSLADYRSSS
jgi:hypothetical protein